MGNDGGSIPTRRELVKEAAKNPSTAEVKELRQEQQGYFWSTDPISQEPLAEPVVSDSSGKLYNKSTILEYLVEGSRKEDAEKMTACAVKSLKDVVEVKFEADLEAPSSTKTQTWKCPVTGSRLGPQTKAVYLVPCGHAFSASAIKEVSGEKCLTCDTIYASNDIIPILPTSDEDIARLSLRAVTLQERGLSHSLKKVSGSSKKRKKKDEAVLNGDGKVANATSEKAKGKKSVDNRINNASTASLTTKVLEDQERSKRRRMENTNVSSLFHTATEKEALAKNSTDFMTRGFTVPATSKEKR